jgi:hypothetical protein
LEILDSVDKTVQVAFVGTLTKALLNFGTALAGLESLLLLLLFLQGKAIIPAAEHSPGQLQVLLVRYKRWLLEVAVAV